MPRRRLSWKVLSYAAEHCRMRRGPSRSLAEVWDGVDPYLFLLVDAAMQHASPKAAGTINSQSPPTALQKCQGCCSAGLSSNACDCFGGPCTRCRNSRLSAVTATSSLSYHHACVQKTSHRSALTQLLTAEARRHGTSMAARSWISQGYGWDDRRNPLHFSSSLEPNRWSSFAKDVRTQGL